MKRMFIECNMGVAGDMLMAALLELHPNPENFLERLNSIGIEKLKAERELSVKCGITGTHIKVTIDGEEEESTDIAAEHHHADSGEHHHHGDEHCCSGHQEHHHHHSGHHHGEGHHHGGEHHHHGHSHSHTGMAEIKSLLKSLSISEKVKTDSEKVYNLIAEAESRAHGKPVDMVHFHEVGMLDAVADIVGVCMLMEELEAQYITCSPIHVGSGNVKCAHGILPVPAPATAYILRDVPTYGGEIKGELCTPTGAALAKYFADEFGNRPLMTVERIGYGMGKKDFETANCVRVFIGESKNREALEVSEISCNLDDMTGEELGFAAEKLLEAGALDVYITPIQMKKNRPGQMLSCLCKPEEEEVFAGLMLEHTTSFGVRSRSYRRYVLNRDFESTATKYGEIKIKHGKGYGTKKSKIEYSELKRLAEETGKGILEIKSDLNL